MSNINWDEFFDNLKKVRAGRTKYTKSQHKYVSFSGGGFSKAGTSFSKNNFSKQSVIKMISNLPQTSIKRCIDYTLKNSIDGLAIDENGNKVSSDEIMKGWSKDFGKNLNSKDAWHLIFSINEPCSDEKKLNALCDAVKDTLGTNFTGHKYAFVLHTHQNNPHVHVVLNKRNIFTNKKIHFNSKAEIKDFFDEARTNFAFSLGARGLKYENKNSLSKDLKLEFSKIKSSVKLEVDDYTAKDKLQDYYFNMEDKNKEIYKTTKNKIDSMNDELNILKKQNAELLALFLQYVKKKNKRSYKLAKQLKANNQIIYKKNKALLSEINKLDKISYKINQINEMKMTNYKDRSEALVLLENFKYNYHKLYPKGKNATKSDFENYKKVCRAIAIYRKRQGDDAIKYFDDSLMASRMLGKNNSLFKLGKKLEILDKSLYLLEHSNLSDDDKNGYKKRLNDNKEFIIDIAKNRFNFVQSKLLKADKIDKNSFLFKEYFKGVAVLNVTPDDELLKIRNKQVLMKDILKDNSYHRNNNTIKKDKFNSIEKSRGGRE
ncbi:relaxase/mobilization nuclease domain-containing protein [Campylobacter ureolyticus]|uniref:relaxase/mobilization nuclease domain-containing protein n=1 Tax=Campylobacter ureolyticus TaxID=827 RepID=UPI002912CA9C|nr:relaxase/mobilization nuclease domain-containing protein [Campylobacter ureolyticus]MDU7070982.1 relaxase [Campylobacter ureolyticus]